MSVQTQSLELLGILKRHGIVMTVNQKQNGFLEWSAWHKDAPNNVFVETLLDLAIRELLKNRWGMKVVPNETSDGSVDITAMIIGGDGYLRAESRSTEFGAILALADRLEGFL